MKNAYRLGMNEIELLRAIDRRELKIFTVMDATRVLGINKNNCYSVLHRLEKKKAIQRLKGGKYLLLSRAGYESEDLLTIASNLYWPSYISFWSALSFYKFTEQLPRTIYIITPIQRRSIILDNTKIRFIKFTPERFFGYTKIGKMFIAEKEKVFLDSLLLPEYAGGITEIFKCLVNAWPQLNEERLFRYALDMNSSALLQRLGYLVEIANLRINKINLEDMAKIISKQSYRQLDPTLPRKGKTNSKWHLVLNVNEDRLASWREIV